VIDLPHCLVRLVRRVDERQAHEAQLELELGEDGFAEGFCGDAGAIGHEKGGTRVHGCFLGGRWPALQTYNGAHYLCHVRQSD
jgi:hypothetical protein